MDPLVEEVRGDKVRIEFNLQWSTGSEDPPHVHFPGFQMDTGIDALGRNPLWVVGLGGKNYLSGESLLENSKTALLHSQPRF